MDNSTGCDTYQRSVLSPTDQQEHRPIRCGERTATVLTADHPSSGHPHNDIRICRADGEIAEPNLGPRIPDLQIGGDHKFTRRVAVVVAIDETVPGLQRVEVRPAIQRP